MREIMIDSLETYTEDDIAKIIDKKEDINTTIKKYLTDYVSTVVPPLFKEAGGLDAKFKRALSYPAHIVTAVFTGSILYIYDRMSTGQKPPQPHDIKLLCTALTLHDVNKYWNESTNSIHSGNYYKLIQDYFEADPFDLKSYFPDWTSELEEIAFLVQHAQESDDAQHETRFSQPKYAKLLPYIKIGDKVASLSKEENPLQEIERRLKNEGHYVHLLLFPEMPQQLLSQIVYRSAKELIVTTGSIPLLISSNGILYLSKDKIDLNHNKFKELISNELANSTNAKPELSFRKFNLRPLLSIPLSQEERYAIFVSSVREKTESGLLGALGKTTYPQGEVLQEALACITYFVYNDKNGNDWTRFPDIERMIDSDPIKKELRKIGKIRQDFAEQDGVGGQKCKAYTIYEIIQKNIEFENLLISIHTILKSAILSKLGDDSSALDKPIDTVRAYNGDISTGLTEEVNPKGNSDICFKCGAVAHSLYNPGPHFLRTHGFTKRATINDSYKRECDLCQIEHLLINQLVEKHRFKSTDSLIFFYFYFDTIFINVDPFQEQMSKVEINVYGTKNEKLGLNFLLGDFATPFHIEPLSLLPRKDQSSKSTWRARGIHTAIKACLNCGCKCVVTSPYTLVRTYDDVFYNEQPTVLEKNLGMDRVKSFKEARLKDHQLDFINRFDGLKGLHRVQRFEPITVIPYLKREVKNFEAEVKENGLYLLELFGDKNMDMKVIAEKGVNLFGKHKFTGSYKRVKIFRTALDALVGSLAHKYPEDEAIRFAAAEVWKDVMHEQYSRKKGKDIPSECIDFVQSIAEYLKEHNLWTVKKISQWGNELAVLYEFEYILKINENGDQQ